jgi:NADPH:quinone reductase-like Zn-dependent oxidoreductase
MHRILIRKPGRYDALEWVEEPDPTPGPDEVVIETEACGVNYADGIIRMGLYRSAKELHGYPITPGFEVAGRIVAMGRNASTLGTDDWNRELRIGDRVIGLTLFNGYATHVKLPVQGVFKQPKALDALQAATTPTVFLTAWWMVHRQVHPEPGETWLVHSAAGGVGSALLQLARLAGVRAIGVVGAPHKVKHAKAMGAAAVIDRSRDDLWSEAKRLAPEGFHAVFDATGVATLAQSYAHLAPTGRLVVYGFHSMLPNNGRLNWLRLGLDWLRTPRFNPLKMTSENRSVLAANLSFLQVHGPKLRQGMCWLLDRFETGQLQALPVETFALKDAGEAQRRIESGQTVGKLALEAQRTDSRVADT